jgi:hypothetical protein
MTIARRQNTRLESEGAEFLVLGNLLIEGVSCFKAYTNFKGYDLVAVNPETGKTARIQVRADGPLTTTAASQSRTTDVPPPSVADLFRIRQLLSLSSSASSTAKQMQRA